MSRIGKLPIALPTGVTLAVKGTEVSVKGPKGTIGYQLTPGVTVAVNGNEIVVAANNLADRQVKANFGATRAHLNNMVKGVSTGWKRVLELNGVGYTAKVAGQELVLVVGFSHDVKLNIPKEVKCVVNKNAVELESWDKDVIGQFAASIRRVRPPEPYLGKGIKYAEEKVRRKAGKTGKK